MSRGLHKHGFEPVPLNQSKTPSRFNSLLVLQSPLSRFQVDLGPAWAGGGRRADIPIPGNGAAPKVPVPAQSQRTRTCAFIKQTSPKIFQGNAVFPPKIPSQRSQLPGREAQSCSLGDAGGGQRGERARREFPAPGERPGRFYGMIPWNGSCSLDSRDVSRSCAPLGMPQKQGFGNLFLIWISFFYSG